MGKEGANMPYKIAVASTDGKVVNQHFGRAEKFYIIDVSDDGTFHFETTRETSATCTNGEHSDDSLNKNVSLLSDCSYVLVSRIGPGAEYALNKKGITAFAISNYIDKSIEKIIIYHDRINKTN